MTPRLRMGTRVRTKANNMINFHDGQGDSEFPEGVEGTVIDAQGTDALAYLVKFDSEDVPFLWISEYGIEPV